MIISKKQYENLEILVKDLEKKIKTLETKLRLQTTISTDLSALNEDITKQNHSLELQINNQNMMLSSVEQSYKRQQEDIRNLEKSLEEKQQEVEISKNTIVSLHEKIKCCESRLEEQKKKNRILIQNRKKTAPKTVKRLLSAVLCTVFFCMKGIVSAGKGLLTRLFA